MRRSQKPRPRRIAPPHPFPWLLRPRRAVTERPRTVDSIMPDYLIAQLDELPPARCPCGFTRRAFAGANGNVASVHVVDIQEDARTHYHKKMTEIYLVLEGEGQMELNGKLFPVKPMTAIYIHPGCRHRAIGRLRIINITVLAFDDSDTRF